MDIESIRNTLASYSKFSAQISDSTDLIKGKRIYITPNGNRYPSVTTVLSSVSDNQWLENWRNAVGRDVADRITKEATDRGTSMHTCIELYLKNEAHLIDKQGCGYELYRSLLIQLKKVEAISLELPLWSDKLKIAGRTDCIGLYDSVLSVIDFKSSRKLKTAEEIKDYFLQCTLYAIMLYERTGIKCKQVVVLISCSDGIPLVFKRELKNYVKEAINICNHYHNVNDYIH